MAVKIQFAQGVNVGNIGEALVGSTGATVVASDGNAAPGTVTHYRWTWIDVPSLSAFPLGLITEGPVSNISFVPDVEGDYHLMVEAFGVTGFKTIDRRVFRVELASTRALPAFDAEADALNFGGQTRGWKPDMEKWLLYLEALVDPGLPSAGTQGAMQVAGAVAGTFAAPTNLFAGSSGSFPWIGWSSAANLPANGGLRFPFGASQILMSGRSALGVDASIIWQTGNSLKFGDEDRWGSTFYFRTLAFWAKDGAGSISFFAGTSGTPIMFANERGWNIGGANDIVDGTKVLAIAAGTPPVTPTSSAQIYYDTATGALRYLRPNGEHVTLADFVTEQDPTTNGFRLTSQTLTPLPSVDVANVSTIYLAPFKSASIALRTTGAGARWVMRTGSQATLSLTGLTASRNYDVFAFWTGSAIAIELGAAWTNDTTRADAIVRLNGVWVKNADVTRRYVGTIRTTSTTQTQDTALRRFIWNVDNQVRRRVQWQNANTSWAITAAQFAGWRPILNSSASAVEFVIGMPTMVMLNGRYFFTATSAGWVSGNGIGIDSTTVNSARVFGCLTPASGNYVDAWTQYHDVIAEGYHKCYQLEVATGGGGPTATFYGNAGNAAWMSTGLFGDFPG